MSATNQESALPDPVEIDAAFEAPLVGDLLVLPSLDLSARTLNGALRDVAHEELILVRMRYAEHRDPVRCAIGISLVLRALANELFGEERINRLRQVSWLNFLLRTSNSDLLRPDVIETMSAALYGDPPEMDLPRDCSFWFDAAESWIDHQSLQVPVTSCARPVEVDL